ncbi:hypothetical protein LZ30DRAFT_560276, partial [Colletotrichum cereale]
PVADNSGALCAPNGVEPEVARQRNCEWDPMSFHWYPRHQVLDDDHQALIHEFLESGPWYYYYDNETNSRVQVGPEEMTHTHLWLTIREHAIHCAYTLRQTHMWLDKGFDSPYHLEHTIHCTSFLEKIIKGSRNESLDAVIPVPVSYPVEIQVV